MYVVTCLNYIDRHVYKLPKKTIDSMVFVNGNFMQKLIYTSNVGSSVKETIE